MPAENLECPYCQGFHPEGARFCPISGETLDFPKCPQCGKGVQPDWLRCAHCAAPLRAELPERSARELRRRRGNLLVFIPLFLFILICFSVGTALATAGIFSRLESPQAEQLLLQVREVVDRVRGAPVETNRSNGVSQQNPPREMELSSAPEDAEETEPPLERGATHTPEAGIKTGIGESPDSTPVIQTASETVPATSTLSPTATGTATATATTTASPSPSPTSTPGPWQACPNTYPSRLHPGYMAAVTDDPPLANRVRAFPGLGNTILGQLQPGERMEILEGPACSDRMVWWRVSSLEKNLTGWTSEGDGDDYWLKPVP
jgi:hypothetical protein